MGNCIIDKTCKNILFFISYLNWKNKCPPCQIGAKREQDDRWLITTIQHDNRNTAAYGSERDNNYSLHLDWETFKLSLVMLARELSYQSLLYKKYS